MPVTILLKAIGLNPEAILAHFFVFDNFRLMDAGAQMEFVADRLRGEIARFDITDKDGNVVVEKDKRITARHVRTARADRARSSSACRRTSCVGRMLARNMVDADTGEIIAKANDELTEALLKKLRVAGVKEMPVPVHQRARRRRLHLARRWPPTRPPTSSPRAWPSTA